MNIFFCFLIRQKIYCFKFLKMSPAKLSSLQTEEKLFSSSYLFTLILNKQQVIQCVNPNLSQMLEFASAKLIGSNFSNYIFPDDFSKYQILLEKALSENKRSFTVDLRILRGDGKDFEWSKWEFFLRYSRKKLADLTGIGHKTGTPDDENNQAMILLEKQKKILNNLTFNQSHDMRARLANILGILEIIEHEKNFAGNGNLLQMLKSEAEKLDNTLKESIAQFVNFNIYKEEK